MTADLFSGALVAAQSRYQGASVALPFINVLPQPRRTFENIQHLALDIAKKGILNPPTVACFTRGQAQEYVSTVNMLWQTTFSVDRLTAVDFNGENRYYILLAGERRFRSCKHLWQEGCEECREERGVEAPGTCFRRHFGSELIEVRICVAVTTMDALFLQMSENTHMPVPAHEEAQAYYQLFRVLRLQDPKYPVAKFARQVGRSPDTIRKALRFAELPENIQDAVKNGFISYGIAIEMARLHEDGVKTADLDWWLSRAVVEGKKVVEFHEMVSAMLDNRHSGQKSLLDIMQVGDETTYRRSHFRRVVEQNKVRALWLYLHYFRRVLELFKAGDLGQPDSKYSDGSPVRVYQEVIGLLDQLMPEMLPLMPKAKREAVQLTIDLLKGDEKQGDE